MTTGNFWVQGPEGFPYLSSTWDAHLCQLCLIIIVSDLFYVYKFRYIKTERKRERRERHWACVFMIERILIHWFTTQMITTSGAESQWGQELELLLSPLKVQEPKNFGIICISFPGVLVGNWVRRGSLNQATIKGACFTEAEVAMPQCWHLLIFKRILPLFEIFSPVTPKAKLS